MIRIVDYGIGNIQAFLTVYKRLGISAERAHTPNDLEDATHLILPGVGHFDHAMNSLNQSGIRSALEKLVLQKNIPIIGICVGMQMLAEGSDEGTIPGLGWISGHVRAFANNAQSAHLPMPHMGWNDLQLSTDAKLITKDFDNSPQFYFLHSYYFDAKDKADVIATAYYGIDFDAVVSCGNIYGIQCHPEKSHHWGAQLLKNFAEL